MISTGQLIFAILFYCLCHRTYYHVPKRQKLHQIYYKNNFWVLIIFILFVLLLAGMKVFLKLNSLFLIKSIQTE